MYKPGERDVILVPLGAYDALKVVRAEEEAFQAGIETYFNTKQKLEKHPSAKLQHLEQEQRGVLREKPNSTRVLLNLATLLDMQDKLPEAITKVEKVLEISPTPADYIRLASLYERQGRYADALNMYKDREARLRKRVNNVAKPKRPVLLLRQAPRSYRDLPADHSYFLCCGISSSSEAKKNYIKGFDEKVEPNDDKLNLAVSSIIRLGFLEWVPIAPLKETDQANLHRGSISFERHTRLMENLKRYMDGYFGEFLSD